MKTVHTNDMVAHIWAQRNQEQGRSNNGQFYFNGDTIYSYGSHFPIATFIDNNTVLITSSTYGCTTAQHISLARQAIGFDCKIHYAPKEVLKAYLWDNTFSLKCKKELEDYIDDKTTAHIFDAAKRRKASLVERDLNAAISCLKNGEQLLSLFKYKLGVGLKNRLNKLLNDQEKLLSSAKGDLEKARRKAKRTNIKRQKELEIKAKLWLAGENVMYISNFDKTLLRINGDNIQSSKGASFPVDAAKKAFRFIRLIKEGKQQPYTTKDKPDLPIYLGHFQIDTIDKQGNVKAGCHNVKWAAIEHVARILKIYP